MAKLVYEFQSVTDKEGNNVMNKEQHANPVYIQAMVVSKGAYLVSVDEPNHVLRTSIVEDIAIFGNTIEITTKNTVYVLEPHIREGE